jgi:hypothetical protein
MPKHGLHYETHEPPGFTRCEAGPGGAFSRTGLVFTHVWCSGRNARPDGRGFFIYQ